MKSKSSSILFAFSLLFYFFGISEPRTENNEQTKVTYIRSLILKTGFIELPLNFDANIGLNHKNLYKINLSSSDSIIFDSVVYNIVGFFPDTTKYFALLYHSLGDMLYPSVLTIDKRGNIIDKQIINATGCSGHSTVEVSSCYDSVLINQNLEIKSSSRVKGIVETNDSIPITYNICNKLFLTGNIDSNGRILINRSEIVDCNEFIQDN